MGTNINKDYLQPIEDYLGQVDDFQSRCVLQIETIQNTVSTLAPKNNPVLVNPTANPAAVSLNNARITTTADVKSYLDSLFSAYKG